MKCTYCDKEAVKIHEIDSVIISAVCATHEMFYSVMQTGAVRDYLKDNPSGPLIMEAFVRWNTKNG